MRSPHKKKESLSSYSEIPYHHAKDAFISCIQTCAANVNHSVTQGTIVQTKALDTDSMLSVLCTHKHLLTKREGEKVSYLIELIPPLKTRLPKTCFSKISFVRGSQVLIHFEKLPCTSDNDSLLISQGLVIDLDVFEQTAFELCRANTTLSKWFLLALLLPFLMTKLIGCVRRFHK